MADQSAVRAKNGNMGLVKSAIAPITDDIHYSHLFSTFVLLCDCNNLMQSPELCLEIVAIALSFGFSKEENLFYLL